jgi:hypothetical protein
MALLEITWKKLGPRTHRLGFDDELGGRHRFDLKIPAVLPEGYSTNAQYAYDQLKRAIETARAKATRRLARRATESEWEGTPSEDPAKIATMLANLQDDLDQA